MRRAGLAGTWVLLLAHTGLWGGPAWGQAPPAGRAADDPRRTPAVEVYDRWKDSVVYLTGPIATGPGPSIDEFFRIPQTRQTISIGSGFVIHPSGYIVTNAHGTERVITEHATLSDGRMLEAELVGLARDHDLALLKINSGMPMRAVQLARAGDFRIGEPVIAIGNPAGLMHTCTQGIVSAADRSTQSAGLPGVVLHGLVQSDAAINPGSSGGPWFNALGQVIGVTAAIKTGTQSIGFAVPVSAVRQTVPEMLDVERRCGLTTGLELQFTPPCVVSAVAAGSPAAALGIQPRDVLELLDGKPIQDRYDFDLALLDRRPGEKLRLDWRRQNQSQGGDLVLAARAKPDGAALLKYYYGLTAVPLDPEKAIATGMRVHRGVVVAAVNPGPPYDRLPTPPLPGDVLARINNIRPRDLDHVGFLLDRIKPGEPVHFVFLRVKDHVPTRVDMVLTLTKKP